RSPNTTYIYTNTSSLPSSRSIGIGLVILPNNLISSRSKFLNIGYSNLVYNRELEGISKVFKYTSR
ncbi:uncharacterized protein J3D65DRAFT_556793, partial [Phyllosticta citribraziliensis]